MSHISFPRVSVYVSIFGCSCGVWSAEWCHPGTCAPQEVDQNVRLSDLGQQLVPGEMDTAAFSLGLTSGARAVSTPEGDVPQFPKP